MSNTDQRRNVQYRLDRLAQFTLGLAERFSSLNKNNQQWLVNHFDQMAAYIQERERWLLVPTPTTLDQVRNDLEKLAKIYISGNYGMFQWNPAYTPQTKSESWWILMLKRFGRILTFFIPVGLMVWMLFNGSVMTWLGITPSFITFLLVAWLLLGIDSILKLGVVSDLLKYAKGIRDLT